MSVSRERGLFSCKHRLSPSAQILHPSGRIQEIIQRRVRQGTNRSVDRVLGLLPYRPNWDSPAPSPAGEYVPPLVPGGGGHTCLRRGGGGSQLGRSGKWPKGKGQTLCY